MKLSFSIPAYNEAANIGSCLDSVTREAESSPYKDNIEIIVVNNACTDSTVEIAEKFSGVKIVSEPRKGLLFARQRGYLSSTGDLIANIDADTILTSGWIDKVFQEFTQDKDLVGLSGPFIYPRLSWSEGMLVDVFYRIGFIFHFFNHYLFRRESMMLQGGNFIVLKKAMEQVGGFNLSISFYGEDTDIARRLSTLGKVKFSFQLPIYTSERRLRAEGVLLSGVRYAMNHFWMLIFNRPFTKKYQDIR